ncbi:MAG: DNA primase [Actinobacteria bacterium]|nr:DNA primase [Actinomycetota bacterium]
MGILDEDIARVREATDIVGLISERLALKRVGRRFVGLCPFHTEKTPSFSVNADLGLYHCFSCQESGDAITFVRKLDGLDFVEAVERLASRAGIQLRYDSAAAGKDRQRRERLTAAVQEAVDFYHRLLLEDPRGGRARGYLRSRGFDGDAARRFVLGWAPEGFDLLSRHLYDRKFSRDDIAAAGLAFVNRAQKAQDFFRSRLMFPIFDRAGVPVGFGARTLDGDGPKYKNTAETALYHKSRLLYGLNWAKAEVGARDEVVICEGYTDVMGFALAGVPNAVATCGTALADEHVQILKAFTRHVILAYDADAAGQNAAEKWYQWEQRFDIEVKVAALPPGRDPGDLWREDPTALVKAVEGASRFMQFKVDRVLAAADLASPEGRARAAEELVPVLREHPNELVREQYIQTAAGTLGFDHVWFKQAIARRPPRSSASGRDRGAEDPEEWSARPPVRPMPVDGREEDVLRWAIHDPALVADWLDASFFADPVAHGAFEVLAAHHDFHEALEASEGPVRALLERLAVEEPEADAEPETIRARLIVNTVVPAAERLQRRLVAEGDDRAMQVQPQLDAVRSAAASGWAAGEAPAMQLVRWISEWT